MRSRENSATARRRAAVPRAARRPSSPSRSRSRRANAPGSAGGARTPASPTSSGVPPPAAATPGAPQERRLGEPALRQLPGEEHRQCHAPEGEARQQVARWAGRADTVDDTERCADRGERGQANVAGSVHEHHVGGELRLAEGLPQGAGAREARVTDRQLPYAQAASLETADQRLIGHEGRRRVTAAGESASQYGEDIARAPPEPAGGEQRNAQASPGERGSYS